MSVDITTVLTPATADEMLALLLALAADLGCPTTAWQSGNPILTLLQTVAQKMADLTVVSVDIAKGGFGDLLPTDEWADLWAQSRFNVVRVPATQAADDMTLTCTAAAVGATYQVGEIIVAHNVTGKTYRNTAIVTIAPSVTLTGQHFAADEPGIASNAAPATITTMVSSLVGVTCTNPLTFIGTDKETTLALVTRARKKLGSLSPNGAKDAYDFVVTSPQLTTGLSTPITRTRTVASETTGDISVYCATAAGAPSGGDVAIAQASVDTYAEPWGITATVIAATPHVIPVTYQAWISGSQLTTTQIQSVIATALADWFSTLDLGGYVIPPDTGAVYVDAIRQVIGSATPGILRVAVSLPAADVVLTPNEVATLGTIVPTVTLL